MPKKSKTKMIWVGVVTEPYGTDVYVGDTRESVVRQIASYCREYWKEVTKDQLDPPPTWSDDTVVETYFLVAAERGEPEFLERIAAFPVITMKDFDRNEVRN